MKLTKTLYRFDINQSVQNLNCKYVDFVVNDTVYRVQVENGTCKIPDEFLQNAGNQKFYECFSDGTRSEHLVTVHDRPQPPDYVYTPTERETFDSLVEKVNIKLEEVPEYINDYFTEHKDEFKGDKGEKGDQGEPGTTDYNELANVPVKNINLTLQNYTFLADIEDGIYVVRSAGYIKTTGGRDIAVNVGTEIIVSTYSGVKAMTYQTGKTVNFLNDSMTLDDKVYSWLNTSHKDLSISSAATNDTLPTSKAVYDFVQAQKTQIITDTENSVIPAFKLANNTEYRFTLELESIEFTLPDNPTDDYISSIVFKSGATATTFTYPDLIKWSGDDISSDKFVPASRKTYEVLIYWNGINYCGIVKGW